MTETIATLTGVTRSYPGNPQPALDAIDLEIPTGRVTAVMGPSGSGKSTLLTVIAGLDRPTSGTVIVAGADLTRLSDAADARHRRTDVGMIFQFFNLLNNLSALDNVLLPAQLGGAAGMRGKADAMDLLDRLGIADLADRYPARLSGGERQRVAIARALVNKPPLLLADEPTGALDSRSGEEVIRLLADLNRAGQTIVFVTHDARLAKTIAHEVVQLVDGRIAAEPRPLLAEIAG